MYVVKRFKDLTAERREKLRDVLEGYFGVMGDLDEFPLHTLDNIASSIPYDTERDLARALIWRK